MKCPSCKNELRQIKSERLVLDICDSCKGTWFDAEELGEFITWFLAENKNFVGAKLEYEKKVITVSELQEPARVCPCCNKIMEKYNYAYDSNVILDRCSSCGGVWTDNGEVFKIATYVKGNPDMRELAKSFSEEMNSSQDLQDLVNISEFFSKDAGPAIMLPKIIFPLGDSVVRTGKAWMTKSIIGANIFIFILMVMLVENPQEVNRFGLTPALILSGKNYFSFLSSMFMHGGIIHLIGNMWFFWIFADNIEDVLGTWKFLLYYLLFGYFASLLHILVNPALTVPAIGASGAIAGIMGAYFVMFPRAKIKTFFIYKVIPIPAYIYLGVWIAFQMLYGMVDYSGGSTNNIGWFAHIGGFISGVVLMLLYKRKNAN